MSKDEAPLDQQVLESDAPKAKSKTETERGRAAEEFATKSVDGKPTMQVKVYSPFRDYFDGPAFSLSAVNATGPFDILPHHHSFISLLQSCEVVIRTVQGEERKILISGGLLHVKADHTVIFLDV